MGIKGPKPKGTLQEYRGETFVRFFVRWQEEGEKRYKVLARCAPENYEAGLARARLMLARMRARWGTATMEDEELLEQHGERA